MEEVLARDIALDRRDLPAVLCSSRLDPKEEPHRAGARLCPAALALQAAANSAHRRPRR